MGCACVKPVKSMNHKQMPLFRIGERKEGQGVKELKRNYQLAKESSVIGSGSYGKVFKSHRKKDPDSQVAIKVMNKAMLVNCLDSVMKEVMILT